MTAMQDELVRRASLEDRFYAFLIAHPQVWIPMRDFEQFGAWRSRLPQVRRRLTAEDRGVVLWNQRNGAASAYLYRPSMPLGRDPGTPVSQKDLFA